MSEIPVEAKNRVSIDRPAAVGWFSLRLLAATGVKALVNSLIGTQTGRRELLAALDNGPDSKAPFPRDGTLHLKDTVWVDYVADIGDGFDATHSVAWLIGRDYLFLKEPGEPVPQPLLEQPNVEPDADGGPPESLALPRADLLIFGGDQVYPYATQADYQSRTFQPYYAARPWGSCDPHAPDDDPGGRPLFVIPGNHDWYDGLISFVRLFCQFDPRRWIGAWYVQQPRSYFSIMLPHGWWIWGVDVASEDDIDPPQLAYFQAQAHRMGPDDRVVLCTAKPAWVECADRSDSDGEETLLSEAWNRLAKIAKLANDGGVPVFLSGDLHHYARHDGADGKQYITCGGGGAFTLGTTMQPEKLRIDEDQTAARKCEFPSIEESKAMRTGAFAMVRRHKLFCAALGCVMLYLLWLFQTSSHGPSADAASRTAAPFLTVVRSSLGDGLWRLVSILVTSPTTTTVFAVILAGFWGFASSGAKRGGARWKSLLLGFFHFLVQIGAAILSAILAAAVLDLIVSGGLLRDLLLPVIAIGLTTLFCGLAFGTYLFFANAAFGWHEQEVFSSQAIQDWKCFLRMKIDKDGLTIYPIGLRKVVTTWKPTLPAEHAPRPNAMGRAVARIFASDTFAVPKGATHLFSPAEALQPHLIEKPIVISRGIEVQEITGLAGSLAKVPEVTTT
ncbi:metallophosphoesterase family protein [Rhizobium sp. Leaf453]|uniref:metallophosphoesterase family protein n=1 Tax=Rhizobium sp. Leaf453 TaxID=1736380 RepID=UPI000715BFD5|nr:metallophosphoesterase [Rhizobium sp. Leaf453]KQU08047.1 hypothetical protein ASG68_23610 [Rhizobium sp. Leaf453]